jgi:hypothetical protein
MRGFRALLASTCAMALSPALAGVSDDLVFCSKLTSPRERISCYDAAARIAANIMPARQPTQAGAVIVSSPVAGTPVKALPLERTPFHGAYATIGGAYGLGAPVTLFTNDQIQGFSATEAPHGPSLIGSLGYNIQIGYLVTGLELSGRYGREGFSKTGPLASANFSTGPIGTSLPSVSYNVDASVHAAIRAGLAFGNTLMFVKAGAGIAHVNQVTRSDLTGTRCDAIGFVGGNIVCTQRTPLVSIVNENRAWAPSVLFGVGIEHNFGPIFARIETEAEAVSRFNQAQEPWFWSARAMAAVGVRF